MQLEYTLALTPALSPGERENLRQRIYESTVWRISDVEANARILHFWGSGIESPCSANCIVTAQLTGSAGIQLQPVRMSRLLSSMARFVPIAMGLNRFEKYRNTV